MSAIYWITGASSGIGEAVAKLLASRGDRVILSARREAELERVRRACIDAGAEADAIAVLPLDVTAIDELVAKAAEAVEFFGQIDHLFNNAGLSQRSLCVDTALSTYRKLFEVDVLGQIALTQAVLPYMLAQGRGHLSVTASVAGKIGVPYRTGYCAAKHAVIGFFDALRAEVAHRGIRVSTVVPGFIRTNISVVALNGDGSAFGAVDEDIANGMDVDRAAQQIVVGWDRHRPEIPVGEGKEMQALWLKRWFPGLLFRVVAKRMRGG